MADRFPSLTGYEFSAAHVRTAQNLCFPAQRVPAEDPLEQRTTAVFFFYPQKPPDRQWSVQVLGEATGVHACAPFRPAERWVFVTDDGEVCVFGQGDKGWEGPISKTSSLFFSNAKAVRQGHAIAVGPNRKVYVRQRADIWVRLDTGLFPQGAETDLDQAGFRDIDGFAENDLYACGGRADLWHYDGRVWTPMDIPTNAPLEKICCADDGFVYVTSVREVILRGRGSTWDIVRQDETTDVFESIVCYNGQVLVSTVADIYAVDGTGFRPANLGVPAMNSKAHLAAGDGILVVAGKDEATMFDGNSWTVILEPE